MCYSKKRNGLKVNCYDNASHVGIMKSEFLNLKEFEDIEHFKE